MKDACGGMRRLGALGVLSGLWCVLGAPGVLAQLDVEQVTLSHQELKPAAQQLVQITLRNDDAERSVAAWLDIRLEDHLGKAALPAQRRRTSTRAGERQRVFFSFRAPRTPGNYTLRLELLSSGGKQAALAGQPLFRLPFAVRKDPKPPKRSGILEISGGEEEEESPPQGKKKARARPLVHSAPSPLFTPVDLLWESLHTPVFTLIGEPVRLRAELRNVGGDLAQGIEVEVQYVDERNPRRRANLARSRVEALAPGEKVELEFSALLPLNTPSGRYIISLHADPRRTLRESRRENNIATSQRPVRLSLIEQEFPRAGFVFEEHGLFVFRWRSRLFKEFKVEIASHPDFLDRQLRFALPQSGQWLSDQEIIPLEGELPGMAHALMRRAGVETLYWRVVGRDARTGLLEHSPPLPFSVALPQEAQQSPPLPTAPLLPRNGTLGTLPPAPQAPPAPQEAAPQLPPPPQDLAPAAPLPAPAAPPAPQAIPQLPQPPQDLAPAAPLPAPAAPPAPQAIPQLPPPSQDLAPAAPLPAPETPPAAQEAPPQLPPPPQGFGPDAPPQLPPPPQGFGPDTSPALPQATPQLPPPPQGFGPDTPPQLPPPPQGFGPDTPPALPQAAPSPQEIPPPARELRP